MNFTDDHKIKFIQEMKRLNYSNYTIQVYISGIRLFFAWSKKDHPKNVNEDDIKEYLSQFNEPNTQRSHHAAIKKFYSICLGQKRKFYYIPYCKRTKKIPIVLSQEEVQRMFDACTNLKHRVILALLYSCGLRVGELLNLKWKNIDRSRMVINVIKGKGGKDRQVMLAEVIIPLLEKYFREYHPKEYVLNGMNNSPQYSSGSVNRIIKQLAQKANINKRVYTHLIRHCTMTHLFEAGADLNLIQRLCGHTSARTTSIYCHTSTKLINKIKSPLTDIDF